MLKIKCSGCGAIKPAEGGMYCRSCLETRKISYMNCRICGRLANRRHPSLCAECEAEHSHGDIRAMLVDEVETFDGSELRSKLAALVEEYGSSTVLNELGDVLGVEVREVAPWECVGEVD